MARAENNLGILYGKLVQDVESRGYLGEERTTRSQLRMGVKIARGIKADRGKLGQVDKVRTHLHSEGYGEVAEQAHILLANGRTALVLGKSRLGTERMVWNRAKTLHMEKRTIGSR